MVDVQLWAGLRRYADDKVVVSVEACNIREMLAALVAAHPGLEPFVKAGISVAIDGEIYADSVVEPIPPGAEVVLMQRLQGG